LRRMQILILGASSNVGTALAEAFASGNTLILTGRNAVRLEAAAGICRTAGSANVKLVTADLARDLHPLFEELQRHPIDLIIDAASASSSKRDGEISADAFDSLVAADFLSKVQLLQRICQNQAAAPAVIFISTVLTLVKSPGRTVYTALKGLYETYLIKLGAARPGFYLLIVYIGIVIENKGDYEKPRRLASAVAKAFLDRRRSLLFGMSGRIYVGLFYVQPMIFNLLTLIQRKVRKLIAN